MRVLVYVEGPSDKTAMETLLAPIIERKKTEGIAISFFPAAKGDSKNYLLRVVPIRALNILRNDSCARVAIVPDLYPKNRVFPHETYDQMRSGILDAFRRAPSSKGLADDQRIFSRFHVFCFKHDLEALILASDQALSGRLGVTDLRPDWAIPVEDQDHDRPPKRIVEELFKSAGKRYKGTVDAPIILAGANVDDLARKCPQCFKPFVDFLTGLAYS